MLEDSRKQELNQYMVKEQNPADYYKEQINWEHGFYSNTYWAMHDNGRSGDRYTFNDKSGGWKFHIHADNNEDWQKISSVLIPYHKDADVAFKTYTAPDANAYSQRPRELFYNKDENQYGKAFTIYPETIEEFEKLAQEINYILENNNLNDYQGFIHGDNQIGDHGRIFYRNEWTGPNEPWYRANADNELPIYKAEGIEDPFLNVLGYPNDNTNADKAAGMHGPQKLVENRLAKLKEAEERIAREQAEREALKQQQVEKEVVEEVELKSVEVPVAEVQAEGTQVTEVKKQPTLNEAIKFAGNKKAKKNATIEDIVANYEVLKQKDVPEGERRTVKKELEQLQSLAQTRMDEAIVRIAKLKKGNEAPAAEEVASLNNLLVSFDDKEVGAYLPSIRKLRAQLEEFQPAKEEPKISIEEANKDVVEKSEEKKEEVKDGKHYSKADLEKIVSTFKGMVERNDGNGTSFESLFEYSVQDLKDYNAGKLTIDADANKVMNEFINIFATDSKGNLSEDGQKALDKLKKENIISDVTKFANKDILKYMSQPSKNKNNVSGITPNINNVVGNPIEDPCITIPLVLKDMPHHLLPKRTWWQKAKNIFISEPHRHVPQGRTTIDGRPCYLTYITPERKSLLRRGAEAIVDGIKELPKWVKTAVIGIATIAAVAFGLNKCSDNKQKVEPREKAKTEVKTQPRKVVAPSKQDKVLAVHAGDIEKAYYDSAIEMQIGAEKRDALYGVIEKRVNKQELDIGAFSVERAAHAMVMYQKIQPNNEINKVFNKVVKGEKLTQVDNVRIKKSVQEAGEYGDGVKGKGTHNQFEQASKQQQVKHVKAVKAMHER